MPDSRELQGWYAAEADFLSEERSLRSRAAPGPCAAAPRQACAPAPEMKVSPRDTAGSIAVTASS